MDVQVTTGGFKELQRAFKAMPKEIADKVLVSGVNAAAKVLRDAAKAAAPVGDNASRSKPSLAYGRLSANIKYKTLRKKNLVSRAAVVSRGRSFWGDFLNRGTRYIPATRWFDKVRDANDNRALQEMKAQMIKKMNRLVDGIIRKSGAAKR